MRRPRPLMTAGLVVLAALLAIPAIALVDAPDGPPRIVFVANGRNPADALAAGPTAGILGAPVFTTETTTLPEATASALRSYGPELVIVLGGPVAVTDDVVAQIAAATGLATTAEATPDGGVIRAAGADRFATAAAIADLLAAYDPAFLPVGNYEVAGAGCAAGEFVVGFDGGGIPQCQAPPVAEGGSDVAGLACTAGQVVTGFDQDGQPVCAADRVDGGDAATVDGRSAQDISFPATLPPGQTIAGIILVDVASDGTSTEAAEIQFGSRLAGPLLGREYVALGDTASENCPGTSTDPSARAGWLCVYEAAITNLVSAGFYSADTSEFGRLGTAVGFTPLDEGDAFVSATWALTGPTP